MPPAVDFIITWIALSNSFWNPFIYWALNRKFRRISRSIIKTKVTFGAFNFCPTLVFNTFFRFFAAKNIVLV